MSKKIYIVIAVLLLVILSSAYYAYLGYERFMHASTKESQIVKLIRLSNEISSYAKRAEGHLFLYLMFGEKNDREKYYKRMESLKQNIQQLKLTATDLVSDENSAAVEFNNVAIDNLLDMQKKASATGNRLVLTKEKNKINELMLIENQQAITEFHRLTSGIRKQGVKQVNYFIDYHLQEKEALHDEIHREFILIVTLVLSGVVLLQIIWRQSKKLHKLTTTLHNYSYQDRLTGIGNRRAFDEYFNREWQRALREATPVGLLMFDVDGFKKFNDIHGHTEGDKCLVDITRSLQEILKRPSDILTRYGGDEFIAILPNTTQVEVLAEQCRKNVEYLDLIIDENEKITITVGYGVFFITPDSEQQKIIKALDDALYQGKQNGRNRTEKAEVDS